VVIPAGVPRKPGMTRDDLFNVSTSSAGILVIVQTSDDDIPKFTFGQRYCVFFSVVY
jgi:malate/lactate dehydrogenase